MDFEDHFTSHEYRSIFWRSFEIYIDRVLPLKTKSGTECYAEDVGTEFTDLPDENVDEEGALEVQDEVGVTTNLAGEIVPKNNQILDYMRRGNQLARISLWEYVARVQKLTKKRISHGNDDGRCLQKIDATDIDRKSVV